MYSPQGPGCLSPMGWAITILVLVALWVLYFVFGITIRFPGNPFGLALLYMGWTTLIAIVIVPIITVQWLPVGVIWAPFAALLCARVAKSRGLNASRYATTGAIYSVLFFWPWVYLIARMHDKTVPSFLVRGAYVIVYGIVWPLATLSVVLLGLIEPPLKPLLLVLLPSAVTWFISLKNLIGWGKTNWKTSNDDANGVIPERVYIMPFAYVFVWALFAGTAWAAIYIV